MTTHEYLSQAILFERKIQNKNAELLRFEDLSTSITVQPKEVNVQSSSEHDRIGMAGASMCDLRDEIGNLIYFRNRIIKEIDSITDKDYYQILYSRYIEDLTFSQIGRILHLARTTINRKYGLAMQEFEKKYGHLYLNASKIETKRT